MARSSRHYDATPRRAVSCYHCDLPVLEQGWTLTLDGQEQSFCCGGCLAVAEHLHTQGLTQYYKIREAPGIKPDEGSLDAQDLSALQDRFASTLPSGDLHIELAVEGITCGGCAWLIEHALDALPGVSLSLVNLAEHRARVHFDPEQTDLSKMIAALTKSGYRASPWAASAAAENAKRQRQRDMTRLIIAGIGAMQAMMFAVALYASDGQYIEPRHEQLFRWISLVVSIPVMGFSAIPFYSGAWNALRHRRVNMDVPVSIALILAWTSSIWHVIQGAGEVYFDSVSMFAFFLLAGRFLEASMQRKALAAGGLDRLPLPTLTTRKVSDTLERVDVETIAVGDEVVWNAGEYLAVDGTVVEGSGQISQALLTGESAPIDVSQGQHVLAGALNGATPLTLSVTAVGQDRALAQLESRSAQAQKERPAALRWAERWAGRFVVFQLLAAFSTYWVWMQLDPSRAFETALAVLVATCPCAFALAAPTALAAARSAAHRMGVVLLSPNALERLANVSQTVTDKTGTLTLGQPEIAQIQTTGNVEYLLSLAAGLERGMSHPLAKPFERYQPLTVESVQAIEGCGVQGMYQGDEWQLGSARWLCADSPQGHGWLGLARNGEVVAWFQLIDKDRPGLNTALQELPQPLMVLSGDAQGAVEDFCERHRIQGLGGLSPEQKLNYLTEHAPESTLALGDGINDAPLLARAGASIALTDASALTRAQSDGIVVGVDLRAVPRALRLAKRTQRKVRQNLLWSIGYNASVLPLAAIGWLPAWGAALGMSLSSLLVVFNAMRLRK